MARKKTKTISKGFRKNLSYQANDIIKRKPKKQSSNKKGPKRNRWSPKIPVVAVVQKGPKSRKGLLPGTIDYKNVVLLRKLINIEGKILPRRINHLTGKQQRYTARAIKSSRLMGLLPFIHKNRPLIQQKKLKKRTTTFAKRLHFSKKSSLVD